MDARRHLKSASLAVALALAAQAAPALSAAPRASAMAPIPDPGPAPAGRSAIAEANQAARTPSRPDRFTGGQQIFDYVPGQIYEVWTAPLRVTTVSLSPGESVVTLAAGDTLRWQIAQAASGEGAARQAHVLIKPLTRGLDTNLVLTTTARVYLIALRSAGPAAFNTAVAWTPPPQPPPPAPPPAPPTQAERLDSAYRIEIRGRRPAWTPQAVLSDGVRTLIVFPKDLAGLEAPALFSLSTSGAAEMVNYRQAGDVFIVDRVLERAELRTGDGRRPVVRILRQEARR